jgi:hypothetical protein
MAIVVSSMDLAERPRNQRPTDPPTTTQKPETTTEDTSNRILSLPNEEKCMKSKSLFQYGNTGFGVFKQGVQK